MIALVLAQAVAGPQLSGPPPLRSDAPCPVSSTSDVVVCARASDSDRLRPLPPRPERAALPRAEARVLGTAKLAAEAEQGHDAQGGPINRAMVRLHIPLGGKKKD